MKLLKLLLIALLVLTAGCGKTQNQMTENDKTNEEVKVDEGLLNVKITIPESFYNMTGEEITQEVLDKEIAEKGFKSAVLNEDGSVTYEMSKKMHKELLKSLAESFDQSFKEMVDSSDYTFSKIEHNNNFTEFTITCDGNELGFGDSFATFSFLLSGYYYNAFAGNATFNIKTTFIGPDGTIIDEQNSEEFTGEPIEEVKEDISLQ